jgi:hypothetical protein
MKVHTFTSEEEAYDASQCDESIADGDLLVVGGVVAVLVQAWPTIVIDLSDFGRTSLGHEVGSGTPHEFHQLSEGESWDTFEGGRYAPSAVRAHQYVQERWEAEMLERERRETGAAIEREHLLHPEPPQGRGEQEGR